MSLLFRSSTAATAGTPERFNHFAVEPLPRLLELSDLPGICRGEITLFPDVVGQIEQLPGVIAAAAVNFPIARTQCVLRAHAPIILRANRRPGLFPEMRQQIDAIQRRREFSPAAVGRNQLARVGSSPT